jgi:hypothetical protein
MTAENANSCLLNDTFAERANTFVVHTAGCFLPLGKTVLENRIFYTLDEEDKDSLEDWVKVCHLL